ncbi:hypothetical protein PILCRDRAFT_823587 [Piloderma croceum F 1598]|uniref:Uncharacterized protein n=1 Tax=Piloderma croceum (strain F 1598) TaxID=765440 RepID=A0A0C3BPT3_PILCF|nr:hypothetical protein PILCRDRAFT_823587 [Piloderma croceum F 1598]
MPIETRLVGVERRFRNESEILCVLYVLRATTKLAGTLNMAGRHHSTSTQMKYKH